MPPLSRLPPPSKSATSSAVQMFGRNPPSSAVMSGVVGESIVSGVSVSIDSEKTRRRPGRSHDFFFPAVHLLRQPAGVDSHITRSRRRTAVAVARVAAVRGFIASSPSADTTPHLPPQPPCKAFVRRVSASSLSVWIVDLMVAIGLGGAVARMGSRGG
ncbi:hypothetical protein STAS_33680 [Striga asiatica]|uniref:Uncharacterized protein n=1 Tax=Striga asiatica TaxID=4170 RepID=A0A5A7RFM2_STRAF|nr:hypothetical protein STAS_33680 [Striga asiatica]